MLPHARFDRLGVACHCYNCHCWRCSCSCLPACLNASMPQICLWRCRCCSQRSHRSSASQLGIAARHRWLASVLLCCCCCCWRCRCQHRRKCMCFSVGITPLCVSAQSGGIIEGGTIKRCPPVFACSLTQLCCRGCYCCYCQRYVYVT